MKTLLLSFLFLSFSATAAIENLQLYGGGGINATYYDIESTTRRFAPGLNVKTDVVYFFTDSWGVEFTSQVKFNELSSILIWDTLMTVGIRHRLANTPYYVRAFYGRSPTVMYTDGAPEVTRNNADSARVQYEGEVYGLGVGEIFTTKKGYVWFIELDASYQALTNEKGIDNDGEVPVEVFSGRARNEIDIFSLYATIGVRVF